MKSITHPGGFKKILLLSIAGINVRLHVWGPGGHAIEHPHRHRWSFLSIPLWGKFLDSRLEEIAGDTYTKMSATGYSDNDHRDDHYETNMSRVGATDLVIRKEHVRYPLLPYTCDYNDIHTYGPVGNGRHISLVITGKPVNIFGYVYK